MIHLESTGGSWYGEIKQMKDYTLYAFFPKTAIYALRTKVVIGTMGVYILCWMTFMLVPDGKTVSYHPICQQCIFYLYAVRSQKEYMGNDQSI